MPYANQIWLYCEPLMRPGALTRLFVRFDVMLAERGFLAMRREIVEATVVEARRLRLTKEEQILRDGGTREDWLESISGWWNRYGASGAALNCDS